MAERVAAIAEKQEAKQKCPNSCKQNTGFRSSGSAADRILHLQRTAGNQAVQRLIKSGALQAKLKIGQPNDVYEQEADRVAEQIMRMPEPHVSKETEISNYTLNNSVQRKCPKCIKDNSRKKKEEKPLQKKEASGSTSRMTPELESRIGTIQGGQPSDGYAKKSDKGSRQVIKKPKSQNTKRTKISSHTLNNSVQRKCPKCIKDRRKKEEEKIIQKKEAPGSTSRKTPELESSLSSIHGSGQPLPDSVRTFFEPHFGHDFSNVRVHTGEKATKLAESMDARAFTVGNDVVFGANEYAPEKNEGRKLLAHELTHVVQQSRDNKSTEVRSFAKMDLSEQESSTASKKVGSSSLGIRSEISSATPTSIQRDIIDDVSSIVNDIAESVEEAADEVGNTVTGLAAEAWNQAKSLANVLGGIITPSGGKLLIDVPSIPVCPILPLQFNISEISKDMPFIEGELPIAETVFVYGSVGLHIGFTPEIFLQLGPCRLNGLRIVIDPLSMNFDASGALSVMTAVSLGGEMRAGLRGEVGILVLWPDPPIPLKIPVAGIEAGLAGFIRGIISSMVNIGGRMSFSGGSFGLSATRDEILGLGLDLGLAGYGSLDLMDRDLCTFYWPFMEWHNGITVSPSIDIDLNIGSSGASVDFNVKEPKIDDIPFEGLPILLERKLFSDNCPLCDVFYSLGLMPSQRGGEWKDLTKPPLPGPVEIYPIDPGFSWGAKCRGACGPDCKHCEPQGDMVVCRDDGNGRHRLWVYKNVVKCPTHEGCRQHDAGYDWCAGGGETSIIGPCHRLPDFEAVCRYGVPNAVSWIFGGPPNDPEPMLFAESVTETGCTGPCPEKSTELEPAKNLQLCLPDIQLFNRVELREGTGASTGNKDLYTKIIKVPYIGLVVVNVYARGTISAMLGAGLGPAWLSNICLKVDPSKGIYKGTAELHLLAGLDGSVTLTGIIGANANWFCLQEVIKAEMGLTGTGHGAFTGELVDKIEVSCKNGDVAIDNNASFKPCLQLGFYLDAHLDLWLFEKFLIVSERWNLLNRRWGKCWDIGIDVSSLSPVDSAMLAHPSAHSISSKNLLSSTPNGGAIPALSANSIDAESLLSWLFSSATDKLDIPNLPADPAATAGVKNPCPVPKPDTSGPCPKPPPMPVILYLPSLKGGDLDLYEEWLHKGPLQHRVGRPRDTNQVSRWTKLMPGRIPLSVQQRAQKLGLSMDDVIRPYWSKSRALNDRMAVDHIIEMQVVPIGREGQFDLMPNYRLMETGENSSVGSELAANVRKMREALESIGGPSWQNCDLTFDDVTAQGLKTPSTWTQKELQDGEQLDAYERLNKPPKPPKI